MSGEKAAGRGPRVRSRRSARAAGAGFERLVADYLAAVVDDRVDRRVKTGAADKGDIGGLRFLGRRVVVECKNTSVLCLPAWTGEARREAANDGAVVGVVVHKRHGKSAAGEQWVSMTLEDFAALMRLGN